MELKWKNIYHLEYKMSKNNNKFAIFSVGVDKGFIRCAAFDPSDVKKLEELENQFVRNEKNMIMNYKFHVAGDVEIEDFTNFNVWGIKIIKMKLDQIERQINNQPNRDNSGNATMNYNDMNSQRETLGYNADNTDYKDTTRANVAVSNDEFDWEKDL